MQEKVVEKALVTGQMGALFFFLFYSIIKNEFGGKFRNFGGVVYEFEFFKGFEGDYARA